MLELKTISPSPHLQSVVQRFVLCEGSIPDGVTWNRLLTPFLGETIYFNLNDHPQKFIHLNGREVILKKFLLGGQFANSFSTCFSGNVKLLGVHINPSGLFQLFKVPLPLLNNRPMLAEDMLGRPARQLYEHLRALTTQKEVVNSIEIFLTQKLLESRITSPAVLKNSLSLIEKSKGKETIRRLAKESKASERMLQKIFLTHIGMSAKAFSRIYRFNEVITSMNQNKYTWRYAAEMLNYYDQAHLINDFKSIAGVCPSDYFTGYSNANRFFTDDNFRVEGALVRENY